MKMCIEIEEKANARFDIPAIPSCNYCFFTIRDTNRPEPEFYCLGARVLRSEEADIPAGKYVLILSPQTLFLRKKPRNQFRNWHHEFIGLVFAIDAPRLRS